MNVLGSTPWQINHKIFDVVLQVWNSGRRLGKLPLVEFDEPKPEKPVDFDSNPKARLVHFTS